MPIATKAAVRSVPTRDIEAMGAEIILSNTYHLFLRPGSDKIKKLGGLHKFMNWERPILTDSGGFQVFSLSKMRKISDEGVEFRSHIDGQKFMLTPEKSLEIQYDLGVDIAMILDEVPAYPADHNQARNAVERTTRWAKRSKAYAKKRRKPNTKVFAIVQGSTYEDLRVQSAQELVDLDFDGYAIGGLAVGEPTKFMYGMTETVVPHLPHNKPRYLMGVGTPENIVESVKRGVDMFDCVLPTRNARHGSLFVNRRWDAHRKTFKYDTLKISRSTFADDKAPIDKNSSHPLICQTSRAYLRHLFHTGEPLAMTIATINNVSFYLDMMKELRELIRSGKF